MDFKKALAKGIQKQLLEKDLPLDNSEPIEALENFNYEIEITAISELQTQIRVKTPRSVRYFIVQIKEGF